MIDDRHYERRMEKTKKSGFTTFYGRGTKKQQNSRQPQKQHWDPMDLDAMSGGPQRPKNRKPQIKTQNKKGQRFNKEKQDAYNKKLCFKCGKPGH